jgi:hypothetical protein
MAKQENLSHCASATIVEITEEMIGAGAEVLRTDALLDISPTTAEILAEEVLKRALAAR